MIFAFSADVFALKRVRNKTYAFGFLGIVLAVMLVALVIWSLIDARVAARRQAEHQEKNVLLALEANISRAIADFDLGLQSAVKGMSTPGLSAMDPFIRQALLFNSVVNAEGFGAEFISDENGWMVYSSLGFDVPVVNLADRRYFRAHRKNPNLGLVISEPLVSRVDGAIGISLSRRINHADGSFAGIVSGTLKLSFFDKLFRSLDIGKNGVVTIINSDGLLIARTPSVVQKIGEFFRYRPVYQNLISNEAGGFVTYSVNDGIEKLFTYRKLTNAPLVVGIGFATSAIYHEWWQKTLVLGCVVLFLTALGGFLAMALSRELHRRSEAELAARVSANQHAAARARLDALFSNSSDMMMVACARPDGVFVYEAVNPVWEKMTGVAAAAAIGRSPLECLGPYFAKIALWAWQECFDQRAPVYYDIQTPEDLHHWEASMIPVFSEDGTLTRLISVARDMTEHHALEARLRQAQRMEAVGQFTAGVAHDFNNLLQAIMSALELLQDQPTLDEEGTDCLEVASGAAKRGAILVHRLLAFSRKQILAPVLLCPQKLVREMEPLLKHSLERHFQLKIVIENADGAVRADSAQLENCLLNLVVNARDAMPMGGVIRLRLTNAGSELARAAGLPAGQYVCFSVEDDGPGMAPDILSRALEPFFTTKDVGKGTGLGLSMVHGFAKQSGGDVVISSALGQGTVVTIWLPRADEVPRTLSPTPEGDDARAHSQSHRNSFVRVLVVDDEAAIGETLSIFLRRAGYTPVIAEDGWAALALLRAGEAYDLLLTDQSMPGLCGSELIEEAAQVCPDLPTLLMTGHDKANGLEHVLRGVGVLRKPFTHSELVQSIEAVLRPKAAIAMAEVANATID